MAQVRDWTLADFRGADEAVAYVSLNLAEGRTDHAACGGVRIDDLVPLFVHDDDSGMHGVEDGAQPRLALAECLFGLLALGNVADDPYDSFGQVGRGDGISVELTPDGVAVSVPQRILDLNRLRVLESRVVVIAKPFVALLREVEEPRPLPYHLFGLVAHHGGHAAIDGCQNPISHHHDSHWTGIEDCLKLAFDLEALLIARFECLGGSGGFFECGDHLVAHREHVEQMTVFAEILECKHGQLAAVSGVGRGQHELPILTREPPGNDGQPVGGALHVQPVGNAGGRCGGVPTVSPVGAAGIEHVTQRHAQHVGHMGLNAGACPADGAAGIRHQGEGGGTGQHANTHLNEGIGIHGNVISIVHRVSPLCMQCVSRTWSFWSKERPTPRMRPCSIGQSPRCES